MKAFFRGLGTDGRPVRHRDEWRDARVVVLKSILLALASTFALASVAVAAPPAPRITVQVTNIKQLSFEWASVAGATRYELWFKANDATPWAEYIEKPAPRTSLSISVSVHLLEWPQARYQLKACNASGCSTSNTVRVNHDEKLVAMGYFKPSTSQPNQYFGFNFALSADGMTLAVRASEKIDGEYGRADIHVYRRASSTSGWRLDARLYPNPNIPGGAVSADQDAISISGDGKTIASGNWVENGYIGAVYLFRREGNGWRQAQRIIGNSVNDLFGIDVKLDAAGRTLVIRHFQDGGVRREGTLDVYQDLDDGSDQFVYATTVPTPPFDDPQWGWCRAFAVSEAGHIVRSCFAGANLLFYAQVLEPISTAPLQYAETARLPGGVGIEVGIDFLGRRLFIHDQSEGRSEVFVYRRSANGWLKEATLAPFTSGSHSAISGDGKILAIGSPDDTLLGRGPLFPPYQRGAETGSVAIYDLRPTGWRFRRFIKADTENHLHSFGREVALDESGHVLAVGSPYDASKATGIDGDREDASMPGRGAVWLY